MDDECYHSAVWSPKKGLPAFNSQEIIEYSYCFREATCIIKDTHSGHIGASFARHGQIQSPSSSIKNSRFLLIGILPPLFPEWLGDRSFNETYHSRFPYIAGEMAQGISSAEMVIAMAKNGMMGMYGAGGLDIATIENSIRQIKSAVDEQQLPWGVNLIHSPQEPYLEEQAVDLFLACGIRCVSASAFMRLEKSVVRYACKGLRVDDNGQIVRPNRVLAKVSRPEVAERFMSPPPRKILDTLIKSGAISQQEADLASRLAVAEDITVEADSGGHTDNRPLSAILPSILLLRDELSSKFQYTRCIRVGAAGGLGSPFAVAGAFAMGAAYVVTGSVNQSAVEAGQSKLVKQLLSRQDVADVIMAPAADMFEMGVQLQVAKRGFLFAQRAQRLYDIYKNNQSIESIEVKEREKIESEIFKDSLENIWQQTEAFWQRRHPQEIERAERNAKHKMALLFRWYLGNSSNWARDGNGERQSDFQIWCGPAMGAFNRWVKGSFLEPVENRSVVQIAYNLLEGSAVITRAQQLRSFGVSVPSEAFNFVPRKFS